MKRFTTIALAALMVLTVLASVIPASAVDSVEVRGPVYDGTDLDAIFASSDAQDDSGKFYLEMNATNFAGFFYDIDDNVATETLKIYNHSETASLITGERTLEDGAVIYNTTIKSVDYEFTDATGWTTKYNIMGLFAEKYVPLMNNTPDKLAKLLVDSDDTHSMRTGQSLELAGGYAITAKQVDVEGDKVWMELTKDGSFLKDEVVNSNETWTYKPDVAGEDDVPVLKVYVKNVFQGQVDSLAVIKGVWLIDYQDIREIDSDDEFGALEVTNIGTKYLTLANKNTITLTRNSVKDIAEGMKFRVADDSNALRYYPFVEYTIGDAVEEAPEDVPVDEVPVDEVPVDEVPVDEVPVDEVPVDEVPVDEVPVDEAPEEPVEPPEEEPAFEAVFAIAGLLAVAFLVRRNK